MEDEVRKFLRRVVDSVESLEVLFFVSGHPEKYWTAVELSRELRKHPVSLSKRLAQLYLNDILELSQNGELAYRFHPRNPDEVKIVEELRSLYKSHRSQIIGLIFSKPIDKLTVFAEAFRFKEESKDG